jgi:YVTN family beta-propeller protein
MSDFVTRPELPPGRARRRCLPGISLIASLALLAGTLALGLNGLRKDGATLADFYAEEHPSDANYLAFAGGSTFGVPLDDPEEENPLYTIDARNIGDLIDAADETWKAYTQSANGPCDDTVHDYYRNDDQPMLYFADVRDRPAYCAAHVVPLEELGQDLRTAATTPNFAWVAPNDCTDMEGCGIGAGDAFLKTELTQIMNSPAWRTQRSLAIITFDEDATDGQHPAQRIPTLVVASQGVRRGYTDPTRYTHYSMLRTVEAALGLGTLTANDLYAPAFNNIFAKPQPIEMERARGSATPAPLPPPGAEPPTTATARFLASAANARQPIAWVANYGSASVSPVNLATRQAGPPIPAGPGPRAIVATPDGQTVYVADSLGDTVTPIEARTGQAGRPIRVGTAPWALAMAPDGKTLYVANSGSATVTPIAAQTNRPGRPIPVGRDPRAIAMAPDGRTAYVLNWLSATVTPIVTATGQPGLRRAHQAGRGHRDPGRQLTGRDRRQRRDRLRGQHDRRHRHPGRHPHRQGRPAAGRGRLHLPNRHHARRQERGRARALRLRRRRDQPHDRSRLRPDHGRRIPYGCRDHRLTARMGVGRSDGRRRYR